MIGDGAALGRALGLDFRPGRRVGAQFLVARRELAEEHAAFQRIGASSSCCVIGRPVALANLAKRSRVSLLTLIVVLMPLSSEKATKLSTRGLG